MLWIVVDLEAGALRAECMEAGSLVDPLTPRDWFEKQRRRGRTDAAGLIQ